MNICPFRVHNFTEKSLACHIQGHEFEKVIAAILKHHAVPPGLFRCFHKLPALIKRCCGRHFNGSVFALLHGINSHGGMPFPGCGDVDQVNVFAFTHLLP